MKWEQRIFEARSGVASIACRNCSRVMYIPRSKVGQKATCSSGCRDALAAAALRACETCGASFRPRKTQLRAGGGRFCSQACNTAGHQALQRPEVQARAAERLRAGYAQGEIVKPKGPDNAQWRGGSAACRARRRASGKEAAALRAYRAANPHKVKEFSNRRRGRMTGRLPRGTIKRIGDAQRWRCAICALRIKARFTVDHITPLARGGEHAPNNLQLLCRPCNVRKNARDPIEHMRSLGRLL